jgi:hypothetical protein
MFRLTFNSVFFTFCLPVMASPPLRVAPNPTASPASQWVAGGNACGPAALLTAMRFGNPQWQRASQAIPGRTDREVIFAIIRERGMRPSAHLIGRPRWSPSGVNVLDLCDMGNELARGHFLPQLKHDVFFAVAGESQSELLRRVHRRLEGSLSKGMPPVVNLRRYSLRREGGGAPQWIALQAHFVTITAVPMTLPQGSRSFAVKYMDPWGGVAHTGTVMIPESGLLATSPGKSPCVEANFPRALVGKNEVRAGEPTALAMAAMIGIW